MGDPNLDKTGGLDADLDPALISPVHRPFGRFRDLQLLGSGGMGTVYKAHDPTLGRFVALKLIQGNDTRFAARLLKEARAQARIEHDRVCRVYEAGIEQGRPFIAMQLIEGRTLDAVADELGLEEKLRLVREVADAIHAAHRVGLIHRDLKPSNVMVERGEDGAWRPWVMDFGLARETDAPGVTVTGSVVGTPHFMSPEQARGDVTLDRRTDVYSLGATLYALLSGKPPFSGGSSINILMRVLAEEAAPIGQHLPSLPADVQTIVMKCLEKEPAKRYDSARALADDLGRYLDGDPIAARRISPLERLVRRARKNKALFVTASVATLLVLGFAAYGLRARALAAREAALAAEFARSVEEARWALRVAAMAPQHDIRPERARVTEALQRIRRRMAEAGSVAEGPGEFALGQGELALGNADAAVEHLRRAWGRGQQGPAVAYALGLATGKVYRRELQQADAIGNATLRDSRRREIQSTLRDPAVAYLKQGAGVELAAPEYVEGLIALYERRDTEALDLAGRALRRSPWLHEALVLEGDVYAKQSQAYHEKGDAEGSRDALAKAEAAYIRAAEIARSDPEVRDGLCQVGLQRVEWLVYTTTDVGPFYTRGRSVCEEALQVDTDNAEVHAKLANLHRFYADQLVGRGKDPTAALDLATQEARAALKLAPDSRRAHGNLGATSRLRAEWQMSHGQDPSEALAQALASLTRAAELVPDAGAINDLANGHVARADFLQQQGQDPRPDLAQAVAGYKRALEVVPDFAFAHGNLGITLTKQARAEMDRGISARSTLEEAGKALDRTAELLHGSGMLHGALADAHSARAELALLENRDPSPDLAAARRENAAGFRGKDDTDGWVQQGDIALLGGRHALSAGEPVDPFVIEARRAYGRAAELDKAAAAPARSLARAELLEARGRLREKQDPSAALSAALAAAANAEHRQPDTAEGSAIVAEARRIEGEWRLGRGQDAAPGLRQGLKAADAALGRSPDLPDALREKALLLRLMAMAERDGEERHRLEAAALAARRDALARDAFLERDLPPAP
jgi:tetratricopeptide (TPR) repeat protein/predicted Ser/Thr protein kinase